MPPRLFRCCAVVVFLWSTATLAQSQRLASRRSPRTQIGIASPQSSVSLAIQKNHRGLLTLGAAVLAAWSFDAEIDEEYAREPHPYPLRIVQQYGRFGRIYNSPFALLSLGTVAATALGYSALSGEHGPAKTLALALESLALSTVITSALKIALGRSRPYANRGAYRFTPLQFDFNASRMSFPSGHTSSVFAVMTVVAKSTNQVWLKASAYAVASAVGCQRVLDRKHWASDVLAGGAIGYLTGSLLAGRRFGQNPNHALAPAVAGAGLGLRLQF